MIPQIKCAIHNDEDIMLLDISKEPQRKNRSYCLECLNETQPKKTIQIKKIQDQTSQYCYKMTEEINKEYNPWINKIKQTKQQLNNLKKKAMCTFDEMIQKCDKQLNEYTNNMLYEQEYYGNIFKEVTRTKLELIAEILSVNHQRENQLEQNKDSSIILGCEIAINFNQLIIDQQECIAEIRKMLIDQIILKNQLQQQQYGYALACNQDQNMIVGGRGNDIVIWQQNQFELKEISVLKGHTDDVNAIVVYQSGDMIISGGSINDKSIKLWRQQDNKWNCRQTINDHKARITDLQLTKNQEQLVSGSSDQLIKIWIMKQPNYQLECIQTIDDHNNCVYWITISQDTMFMASSSNESYFNIYKNEQSKVNPWKKFNKIETKGIINRVYFTNNDELLVQQKNPPLLIVYSKNTNNQYQAIQDIRLNQPDNKDIFFPIFEMNNKIYLKNDKFIYIIRRSKTGKYFIQQIFAQWCRSGCRDCTGEGIILRNSDNLSIDIYK